jgi:hypothetical protein
METNHNTYGYVFWNNTYTNTWYAIPTDKTIDFFSGKKKVKGVLSSTKFQTLVEIINNPNLIKK